MVIKISIFFHLLVTIDEYIQKRFSGIFWRKKHDSNEWFYSVSTIFDNGIFSQIKHEIGSTKKKIYV